LDRYTEITLNPLSRRESRQLVENLLAIDNLPESVKEMILRKSEGNPFFIEEVIRSLIDRDLVYRDGERWKARSEVSDIDVPDTIQSVLLSRVDRLQAEAKYVLQCASVIGRLFKYRLLSHLAQHERNLDRYLNEFEERELVYEERTTPELEYAFKHALTQEATYQGILERRRREFHHQVAIGIERLYGERLEDYYDELAHHYSRSADAEKAVEYLLKAGEKAKKSYANDSAISNFKGALELLERHGIGRNDWKLEALRGLGEVHIGIGKTIEAEKAFDEAIALAKEMKLPPRRLARLYDWISEVLFSQARFDEITHYAEMGLELLGDDTECLEAALMNSKVGMGSVNKGDIEKWKEYAHKNMAFVKNLPYSEELRGVYVQPVFAAYMDRDLESAWEWSKYWEKMASQHHDLRAVATAWMYQSDWILIARGDYKNSLSLYQKALEMFKRIGDDRHATACYEVLTGILLNSGNTEEADAHAQVHLRMAEQRGNPLSIALAYSQLGDIAMCKRRWEEAIAHFRKAVEVCQSIGSPFWIAPAYLRLGIVYLKNNDYHQAVQFFEEAAENTAALSGEPSWKVDLFLGVLQGMEEAYMVPGTPEKYMEFFRSFNEWHADVAKNLSLRQWYLELAQPSKEFPHLAYADDFETETIDSSWQWIDEFGDCAVAQLSKLAENQDRILGYLPSHGGLEICAANGRDLFHLNMSAPRLIREISGDFAVEVCVSSASDEKPRMGGLLVWKDRDNFLRFEKGVHGQHEVRLHGYVGGKYQIAGRGLLSSTGGQSVARDEAVHLRLERTGEHFSAYCSVDGENWLTCGKLALLLADPIQIGIHAIGMIDRTIYCGSFKEGTATLFRGFKLWTR